ncbi:hypothetical protein [Desulfomonile tiedjei]|uniref:Uncharacterized protein n=1 Tax=Desulfomonile tiedjei (strain ATCC 49306 / DSM 6799 / DCB-1) TaxID=706587 RepID=I4C5P8_DESTA|nr:hypothetical protein [Desulfomonile tiedjei]AFM24889.1 hypothetical protein Desti_2195 [Desulfomonile tiedjei DSM 6799]
MKGLIGEEQTYGPWKLSRETVDRWPLLDKCYAQSINTDLSRAIETGFLVDTVSGRRRYRDGIRGIVAHERYYGWACSVLIPFVSFVPRRKLTSVQIDLLPSCQTFPETVLDKLETLLMQYRVPRGDYLIGQRVSFVDALRCDADELGARLVEFVQANARYREPERTEFEQRLGVVRPAPFAC